MAVEQRKRDHLRIALEREVGFASLTTGLERYRVRNRALPERDLADVDLAVDVLGKALRAPLLISCMTGGVSEAGPVNRALAAAAQHHGVALGLGSGRPLLDAGLDPRAVPGFALRDVAPDVLLLANIGAAQLHEHPPERLAHLVGVCGADALVVHLNAVQEAVQPEGDTRFGGLRDRIGALCERLEVPVVVKEVGFGLAPADVAALVDEGVAGVDVAGAGGTNWARVEGLREERAGRVAAAFLDWGLPTADAVREARRVLGERGAGRVVLIGSGGVRDGVDALKLLCLGADLVGIARGLLRAAADGPGAAIEAVGVLVEQLRIALWAAGGGRIAHLGPALLVESGVSVS